MIKGFAVNSSFLALVTHRWLSRCCLIQAALNQQSIQNQNSKELSSCLVCSSDSGPSQGL